MPSVAVGVELYYEEYGSGPAILGIHGTPSSVELWRTAAVRLGQFGRCIVYDRRGFGRSQRPVPFDSSDLDDQVDDAVALLSVLRAHPAVVIGRSTGGLIALALAAQRPEVVRALVLLEPALFTADPEADAWAKRLRQTVLAATPGQAAEVVIRAALGDSTWQLLPEDLRTILADGALAVVAETRGRGLDLSDRPLVLDHRSLHRLTQPVLLVSGQDSVEACQRVNERLAQSLPNAETVVVPGGHLIDPAHPAVLDFVRRLSS